MRIGCLLLLIGVAGCASLPEIKVKRYAFPKNHAFVGDVQRPYQKLGLVRSRVDFTTLDPNHEEQALCRNYYNKAVSELVQHAKKGGGDAVIDVRTVVFYEGGKSQTFQTPECADDGAEGQVLAQGIAVKWTGPAPVAPEPSASPSPVTPPAQNAPSAPDRPPVIR